MKQRNATLRESKARLVQALETEKGAIEEYESLRVEVSDGMPLEEAFRRVSELIDKGHTIDDNFEKAIELADEYEKQ